MMVDFKGKKCPVEVYDFLIERLTEIKVFFETVRNPLGFINSSLLFVFDRSSYCSDTPYVDVKMIDIGHMSDKPEFLQGYL